MIQPVEVFKISFEYLAVVFSPSYPQQYASFRQRRQNLGAFFFKKLQIEAGSKFGWARANSAHSDWNFRRIDETTGHQLWHSLWNLGESDNGIFANRLTFSRFGNSDESRDRPPPNLKSEDA